jgi:dihydrofolate reductase
MKTSEKIKVSVFIATSVDGFIARKDGDVAWLDEYEPMGEGEDGGYTELFGAVDALVMGRGTFEKVLTFQWPYGDKALIVLSKSLTEVPEKLRASVRVDASAPEELMEKLSGEGYQHIYLDGGKVIQSFLRAGLVDEMILTRIPVLLGEGIPLFGMLEKDVKLKLLESKSWKNGFVQVKYAVVK